VTMDRSTVLSRIELHSENLMMAQPSDVDVLAHIHTGVTEMGTWAQAEGLAQASSALFAIAGLLEKIILNEVENPTASIDIVARGLCAFQMLVRDARTFDEVHFPVELQGPQGHVITADAAVKRNTGEVSRLLGELCTQFDTYEHAPGEITLNALRQSLDSVQREAASAGLNEASALAHAAHEALGRIEGFVLPVVFGSAFDWLRRTVEPPDGCGASLREIDALLEALARVGEGSPARAATVLEGDPELLREFIAEALEHLHNADVHILTIEMRPRDADSINAVFRAFHTIKGVAGFLALDEIQALAHESENVLDLARKGELELAGNYVDLVFEAVDTMKRLIQRVERALSKNEPMQCEEGLENLVRRLQNVANGTLSQQPGSALDVQASGKRIGEILVDGGLARRSAVMAALESQHTHEPSLLGEQLISEIIITRSQLDQALAVQAQDGGARKLGEILVSLGAATWEDINRVVSLQQEPAGERLGTILVRSGEVAAKDVARALRVQQAKPGTTEARDAIKVDAERLDQLIDLIGELVIAESMVSQSVELKGASQKLVRQFNQLDKITRELQEMGTSLRMVPIRATFQKMSRIVRDLAKKTGKKVEFITEGEDTELDKTVVDQIGDPLIHMVRNAIDHGLEASPEARTAAGKAEAGRVTLRALHKGGSIYIEIQDDGRGLNRDVILAKARERGLVREGESLSDREIYNLVFEPGFSTAKQVTDISGRGVGMDVVRRNIEGLRGQIDIQSELGKGSLFSIRLPLTLAIIDGMVVRVGNERYIVPTLSIIRSIKPMASNIVTIASRGELLVVQNDMFPLFRLHTIFDIVNAEKDPLNAIVLILENEGRRVGLLVDELLGQQQIVIKSLGDSMRGLEGVAGAAIMPDGTVGLIIDVNGIARLIGDVGPGYGNQSSAA